MTTIYIVSLCMVSYRGAHCVSLSNQSKIKFIFIYSFKITHTHILQASIRYLECVIRRRVAGYEKNILNTLKFL